MPGRRKFLQTSLFGGIAVLLRKNISPLTEVEQPFTKGNPIVISTWNTGLEANKAAWKILVANGRALDAVEEGVKVTETSLNCCVGLGANPDRDGFV